MPMHGGGCQWLGVRIVEQTVDVWRRVMVMVVFGWWYLDGGIWMVVLVVVHVIYL